MSGLGDRARTVAMVMEWQAEEEPREPVDVRVGRPQDRRLRPVEASLDDLGVIVRARVAVAVRPAPSEPPEEMIGEPSF